MDNTHPLTDADLIDGRYEGNLNLYGYDHPLPAGLTTVHGNLYLGGYAHPLPAGLTTVDGVAVSAVPVIQNIDAAILAAIDAGGKLTMGNWHTCGTTHCRAGWAITLAGEAGADLEREVGPAAAGALIYHVSRPGKPVPDFHASTAAAMSSIRADAAYAAIEAAR